MSNIERLLTKRLNILDRIPGINQGGCAIVALETVRFLQAQGHTAKIVYLFRDYDSSERHTNTKIPVTCAHAMVFIDNKYYLDTTGVYYSYTEVQEFWELPVKKEVSPEYVEKTIKFAGNWNPRFNRNRYQPVIHRILKSS